MCVYFDLSFLFDLNPYILNRHTFVGLKCLTETNIEILCDQVSHTRLHTVEMGCQLVQLLSAHIVGPTMCVNLTLAKKDDVCFRVVHNY